MWSLIQWYFDKHRIIPWTEMFAISNLVLMFIYVRKEWKR